MEFFKTTSLGNDFIVINHKELENKNISEFVKEICDRDNSVGGDGVVTFSVNDGFVDFRIFNADGSEAELSGNGMAAVSSVLFYNKNFNQQMILNTKSGKKNVKLISQNQNLFNLYLQIGIPDFNNLRFFPFLKEKGTVFNNIVFYPVSVGNPHVVIFFDFESNDWYEVIKGISDDYYFPYGTNFELVKFVNENRVNVLFFERGVGITPFSSTGCSAVASVINKLKNINKIIINVHKEDIYVKIKNNNIYLENKTKILYKGILM